MADFFEALFKFFTEFTLRKLLAVVVVAGMLLVLLSFYERYTSSFRLSRLQKATELLARLQEIQAHGTNSNPEFDRARTALITQAVQAIEEKPMTLDFVPSKLTFSIDGLWKFISGSSLWLVFALFQLPKLKTTEGKNMALGMLMLAGISGFFAIFVPAIWWPWFHILIYPWLLIAAVVSALMPVALVAGLRSARKKAQSASCINNLKQIGLGARLWATDHGGVLPSDFAAMKDVLGNQKVTVCPVSSAAQYEILSPGFPETNPSLVFARCPIHNNVVLVDGSVQQLGARSLVQQDGKWTIKPAA